MFRQCPIRERLVILGLVLVTMSCLTVPAGATTEDMDLLPVTEPTLCMICHLDNPNDSGSFALNSFGDAFLANGRIWDATLADMDSDGDTCLNGVELGDADGDGEADGNVSVLLSNPGDGSDCGGATVDALSWGTLKSLFNRD